MIRVGIGLEGGVLALNPAVLFETGVEQYWRNLNCAVPAQP